MWWWALVALAAVVVVGLFRRRRCVFCAIVAKEVPATIVHEDDLCVCFKDTSPAGEHHFLVVPKQHITNVNHLRPADLPQVDKMAQVGRKVLEKHLTTRSQPFVMAFTKPPFNMVPHLHLHCVTLPLTCSWLRGLGLTSFAAAPVIDVRRRLRNDAKRD